MIRNQIANAIVALLQSATLNSQPTFQSVSRKLLMWTNVPVQPAAFVTKYLESSVGKSDTLPRIRSFNYRIFVFMQSGDDTSGNASSIDDLLDSVELVFTPSPVTGKLTLGGLVSHCRIDGQIVIDPGDLDGQALITIPVSVLLP